MADSIPAMEADRWGACPSLVSFGPEDRRYKPGRRGSASTGHSNATLWGRPPPPAMRERRIRRRAHSCAECRPCVVDRPSQQRRKVFLAVEGGQRKDDIEVVCETWWPRLHVGAERRGWGASRRASMEVLSLPACPRWMAEHWKSTYARTPARTASTTASPWITSGDFLVSRRVSKGFRKHFHNQSGSIVLGKPLWNYRTSRPS
jgi:hypothetical protein